MKKPTYDTLTNSEKVILMSLANKMQLERGLSYEYHYKTMIELITNFEVKRKERDE